MFQLKFNDDFTQVIMDIPCWKNKEDIPDDIKKFIINTSNKMVFYEENTGNFYCGKCVEPLDETFYCSGCGVQHKKHTTNIDDLYISNDITILDKKIYNSDLNNTRNYFVFNVVNKNVWLYCIEEKISYDSPFYSKPYKSSVLNVCNTHSYFIKRDGLINLKTNIYIPFNFLVNCYNEISNDYDKFYEKVESSNLYKECDYILMDQKSYLYIDNLYDLKNTVYRYSRLWQITEFLNKENSFCISDLTLNPLYYPQFEYLVNYKLYDLALHAPNIFKSGKSFKEIFGVDKKYLPFMVECNINLRDLKILQIYPTTDIEVLKFFSEWLEVYTDHISELVNSYKVDLKVLKDYLICLDPSRRNINEYFDYIYMAKELNLDLFDKKVLYPVSLRKAHDELFDQIEVVLDPVIEDKIGSLSKALLLNMYEDDNYVIYPVSSIKDLVEESRQQKNCVRTYCERIADNECQIYLMRKKEDINKSFVTIEIHDNKIVQARLKYNEIPSEDIYKILKDWEKNLISVIAQN